MEKKINVEWRLENICCWDNEIHGALLSVSTIYIHGFYPRGLDGEGDNFIVKLFDSAASSRVELSFIGADGSLLCKQELQDPDWEGGFLTLPPGPKFEDYVRTVTNVDVLKLRLHLGACGEKGRGYTRIEVIERRLKIPALLFKDMKLSEFSNISKLCFDRDEMWNKLGLKVGLVGFTKEDSLIYIKTYPISLEKNSLFHASVSLLDCHDVVIESKKCKHIFRDNKGWMLPATFRLDEVNKNEFYLLFRIVFILKNVVTESEVEVYEDLVEFSSMEPNRPSEKGKDFTSSDSLSMRVLSEELMCLYKDQNFSDCSLKCDDVTIPVHRAILCSRSPVFKSMLSRDMQEAGCVDIADMDSSTLARFLAFLYTGRVQDLQSDVAFKLYYAADKYQVPSLKKVCGDFLGTNVSVSNVCEILSLADRHQDDELTSVAQDFILKNYKAVLCSEEWIRFMLKETLLGVKTLAQFAERNRVCAISTQ